MNKFFIVLSHTFLSRLKAKSFIFSTAFILLLLTLFANIGTIVEFFIGGDDEKVAVIDETNELLPILKQSLTEMDEQITLELYNENEEAGKEAVQNGDYDGLLVLSYDENNYPEAVFYENNAIESWMQMNLQQQLQQMKVALATERSGIDEQTLATIYEPINFEKIALDEAAKTDEELNAARGIVYIMLFVLYMAVIIYGQMIATDVATEKSSRVMEILISSASPITHLFAKIIAIALLGITQMIIIFMYALWMFKTRGSEVSDALIQEFGFSIENISLLVYGIVFFLLGYLLYATVAAMLGSLVSRVEDVQQLTMPLVFIVMIAFFISMFGLAVPDAKFITISSYIPFFTPMIMFLRIGMLEIPTWEIILSITILIVTIILLSWLSARIYRGGVLMYGPSRSLKDMKQAFMMTKKEK